MAALVPRARVPDRRVPRGARALRALDRPTLFYSFTDDAYAPEDAIGQLLRRLNAVRLDHARVDPRDHRGDAIGHFGLFRTRFAPTLWQEAVDFLRDALKGRTPRRKQRLAPRPRSLHDEVMADLEYGRAS